MPPGPREPPGNPNTTTGLDSAEAAELPKLFFAVTRKVYVTPLVRPVTVPEVAALTPSAKVVQVAAPAARCSRM